jgi:S1-C subfamily serine protease
MSLQEDQDGVLIENVSPNSPADEAGLEGGTEEALIDGSMVLLGGDVIISWNDGSVDSFDDLTYAVNNANPGDIVEIGVLRDGEITTVQITLGEN